jgi:hypothetical protein
MHADISHLFDFAGWDHCSYSSRRGLMAPTSNGNVVQITRSFLNGIAYGHELVSELLVF